MAYLLDILGASVIGGFIFLMIANSNARISNFSDELLISTITHYDAVESTEIIEFDLYKIGYGITGQKIKTYMNSITINNPFKINEVVETAISSLDRYGFSYKTDANCSIDYIEMFGNYENVIGLFDNNISGQVSININLLLH